jgi:sigma-B regulation protein RsbU (phosphoserine phosphatase)
VTVTCDIEASLESQLELARAVQISLLPKQACCLADWEAAFSYQPAGFVSGDYLDLIPAGADAFYFALGDISGKGVAASMLMSYLHATLRTLLSPHGSMEQAVTIASHNFCQSALPAQFATLVLGKADRKGSVELVNAGHTPVLLVEETQVEVIAAASLPLGMFCSTEFTSVKRSVKPGSTLFLYSDGLTESTDDSGIEFEMKRLENALLENKALSPSQLVETICRSVVHYTNSAQLSDDRTMLALRWSPEGL